MKKRIVAEVTRNWSGERGDLKTGLLSQRFEEVIRVNAERGFALESWHLTSNIDQDSGLLIETIIAVFVEV